MTGLPVVVPAAVAAVALALPLFGWALVARPGLAVQHTRQNLTRGLDLGESGAANGRGAPSVFLRAVHALTPRGTVARINRMLSTAGRPGAWPLSRVIAAKLVLELIAASLSLLLAARPGVPVVVLAVAVTVVSYYVPELLLHSRGQERQQAIALELADTPDQMTIAVEAGLGFEAAMARAGRNGKGPLAEELVRTLQDIAVGQPRREACIALAERTGVPDLRRFIRAVVQADAYGVSIVDVPRTQAQEMRLKRRQRAEERAMQIPVKVIFPLILFILPALSIVLLGPAVINIVGVFNK